MSQLNVISKLFINGIRYRYLKYTGRSHQLQSVSLEITHRCMCRCVMCNIWRIPPQTKDLDLSDWVKFLSSSALYDLRELDITGGEPFLRQDLIDLLKWIDQNHTRYFPRLKTIAITSNGLLTERIIQTVKEIIIPLRERKIDLVFALGLDAIGELHSKIRGVKGAWQKLETTINRLISIRENSPNLVLGIKTTITPMNTTELDQIVNFASQHQLFTIISPCIITSNRFGNEELADSLKFNTSDLERIKKFYQSSAFAWKGHREAILQYLKTKQMKKPCSAGFNTVFIHYSGEVCPCPIIPVTIGNIRKNGLRQMLDNATARCFRKNIGLHKECKICTEPGLERLSWPFEGFTCLRWLIKLGPKNFDFLSSHMGLKKYL